METRITLINWHNGCKLKNGKKEKPMIFNCDDATRKRGEIMLTKCRCIECEKSLKVVFDFRYVEDKKLELYAIVDDSKNPRPTGYCVECVKDAVINDLDLMVAKLNNSKVSFIDFSRRDSQRVLQATGTVRNILTP